MSPHGSASTFGGRFGPDSVLAARLGGIGDIGTKLARAVVRLDDAEAIKHLEREVGEVGGWIWNIGIVNREPSLGFSYDFRRPVELPADAPLAVDGGDCLVSLLTLDDRRQSRMRRRLRGERNCSRPGERLPKPGDHHEVSVKPNTRQSPCAKRRQAVLVLEPAKLSFHDAAASEAPVE